MGIEEREGKIRVLQLIAPNTLGGAERVVLQIQENLPREEFSSSLGVFVWVRRPKNVFLLEIRNRQIPHSIFPMRFSLDWANLSQLFRYLKKNRIQLLHTHGYRSDILGFMCARAAQIPVVTTLHGWTGTDWRLRLYGRIQGWCLPCFQSIIAVSGEIQNQLVHQRGIDQEKVFLLPNAAPFPKQLDNQTLKKKRQEIRKHLGLDPEAPIIGFIGRLSPEKNLTDLLKAVAILASQITRISCLVAGEGPERFSLERQARDLGIDRRVHFLGFQRDVSSIYKIIDVMAMPSLTEGTPMVLLEAMALGIPVVATRVGGMAIMIEDGVDGLLVRPADVEDLAKGLERILTNPALAHELGRKARKKVRSRFSLSEWIQNIQRVYHLCLQGVRPI